MKIPIKEVIRQEYDVVLSEEEKCSYLIAQEHSLLLDQIERLRGHFSEYVSELILLSAKKNPRQEEHLKYVLEHGFFCNNTHYSRFGKSASQAKDGITAFVCDEIFEELYRITQMDLEISSCVISKYESQRCLLFTSCTLIPNYIPNIVIIGEYEKVLRDQLIRYVTETEKTFPNEQTGEEKAYRARTITEGRRDIPLSPFDGCGCHESEFMERVSQVAGLDYLAAGSQIRLPFIKGYSVYVPFRSILKEWGYSTITDIYGKTHPVDEVDCIWNTSMFKGHKLFQDKYGADAWIRYMQILKKYSFKLGISKYSHHTKDLDRKSRMNFQYLQCLDLWNPDYANTFGCGRPGRDTTDIPKPGKIVTLAAYTTDLFEKIAKGDKFYTCKFLGLSDTKEHEPESSYLKAILINDAMRGDPAIKKFIRRKLQKAITEAKYGKIYAEGFYHTIVGDMIGYLQYAVGQDPTGCLKSREFFTGTLPAGEVLSFRSPLVCPSEVNKVTITSNETTARWFSHFKNQDIAMINMHDLSAPQQGGADCDGDAVLLCTDPSILGSKIDKPIIIDLDDKTLAAEKPYTKENIIEYEIMTRDNRIGEITNAATSILNKYTADPQVKRIYEDSVSLLRLYQGHEIDFLKTGTRWYMGKGLRQHLQQLPYFLLFSYPKKMKTYEALRLKNKEIENPEEKLKLNAYHSPSPMNELCEYICAWERKRLIWDNTAADTRPLILNHSLDLSDRTALRKARHRINKFADEMKALFLIREKDDADVKEALHQLVITYKEKLSEELGLSEEMTANYVIQAAYRNASISKSLAWLGYDEYILKNLRENSPPQAAVSICEAQGEAIDAYEYLGKYYILKGGDTHLQHR